MNANQPTLTLLVFDRDEPRMYAQSTLGHRDSTKTFRDVSRSIKTAKDSEHVLQSYAMLDRCPTEVLQRKARSLRSSARSASQNSLKVMAEVHHTVMPNATPFGEFTGRCHVGHTVPMDIEDLKAIRRANLGRAIDLYLGGNQAALARLYNPEDPKPQQISDLLKNKGRSFGEKVARKLEEAIGLQRGELDIEGSALVLIPGHRPAPMRITDLTKELTQTEYARVLEFVSSLKKRRRKTG